MKGFSESSLTGWYLFHSELQTVGTVCMALYLVLDTSYVGKLASFPGSPPPNSRPQTPPLLASHIQHPVQVKHRNSSIGNTSLVPRPHPARIASSIPDVILKAIRAGVGFVSGTETRGNTKWVYKSWISAVYEPGFWPNKVTKAQEAKLECSGQVLVKWMRYWKWATASRDKNVGEGGVWEMEAHNGWGMCSHVIMKIIRCGASWLVQVNTVNSYRLL